MAYYSPESVVSASCSLLSEPVSKFFVNETVSLYSVNRRVPLFFCHFMSERQFLYSLLLRLFVLKWLIIIIMVIYTCLSLKGQALCRIMKEEGGWGNKTITQMFL